jgi:hypothetical protein
MNKKRWAILILILLLLFGYYKLFYKTWNNESVPKSTDCIVAIDVKKVTNTLIWNVITTPSQWSKISLFSEEGKVDWDDMVKLPDYVFVFHKTGEPATALYAVVEINDEEDFKKGLQQYHFEKTATGSFISTKTGVEILQNGNKLLIGNAAVENRQYLVQAADELFKQKQFMAKDVLQGNISTQKHFSLQLLNSFLGKQQIITAGFDKESIYVDAAFTMPKGVSFASNTFLYCDTSLCSIGCTQPQPGIKQLLDDSARAAISRAVNFNIDSLLLPGNAFYQLDIKGIPARVDSAISYTYDDNFNPVEKVVVNTVEEPAFNFTVEGKKVTSIYNYWERSGKIEKNEMGDLFTPMPFVKSYCHINDQNKLSVTANNHKAAATDKSINCILFIKLLLAKIPGSLQQYFPADIHKAVQNIESAEAIASNKKGQIILRIVFNKKKNDLPLFER